MGQTLEAQPPELYDRLIDLALGGDLTAARIIMDRVAPVATMQILELQQEIAELRELAEEIQERRCAA